MKTPLKIAHVVCTYPPYRGGMGNVASEYVERLRARGHNVHVFTIRKDDVGGNPPGSPLGKGGADADPKYVHRIPSIVHMGNAAALPSLFHRMKGFDLVHLHYPFFGGSEPVIILKALRSDQGLVMTYHMDAVVSGVKGAIFSAHRRLMFPWLMSRVDRILVSSQDYSDTSALAEIGGLDDRIEVHPFGVDLERFHPGEEPELRQELGIGVDQPVLVFVGGLDAAHHFKGLTELFAAVDLLKSSFDWKLVIVGQGELRASYEAQVADLGLQERIVFAGGVSDEDLPRYYRMADVHVFPSTKRAEAFGLVALEAAASGVPSIASSLPGVRTVVQDGATGLLVTPGDVEELSRAIATLLEQQDVRERFGAAARDRAEQEFAWGPLVDRLEEVYRSVVEQQADREY